MIYASFGPKSTGGPSTVSLGLIAVSATGHAYDCSSFTTLSLGRTLMTLKELACGVYPWLVKWLSSISVCGFFTEMVIWGASLT